MLFSKSIRIQSTDHGQQLSWRLTPLAWMVLAGVPLAMSTLWWQQQPSVIVLVSGLVGAAIISHWWAAHILAPIQCRWLLPRAVHCFEPCTIGCTVQAHSLRGPVQVSMVDQGRRALSPIHSVGPAPTRLLWSTRFANRGLQALPDLEVSTTRPFAMLTMRKRCQESLDVLVLPALGQVRPESLQPLMSWLDAGFRACDPGLDEVAHLRPYRHGDSMRAIHWRATARSRSIMVTERHAPHARKLTILLDTRGPGRRSSRFERLVCAMATTVVHFQELGWEVRIGGPWCAASGITGNRDHLLETLALVECHPDADVSQAIPSHEACLVFSLDDRIPLPATSQVWVVTLPQAEQLVRMGRHIK